MNYLHILILFISAIPINSQDRSSSDFLRIYNKFREDNNLPKVEYSMELDKFAEERLLVSAIGTSHCFPINNWKSRCPTIDLHFKFSSMVADHNSDSMMNFRILTENMSVIEEFLQSVMRKEELIPKKRRSFVERLFRKFLSIFNTSSVEVPDIYKQEVDTNLVYEYARKDTIPTEKIAEMFFHDWYNSEGHKINFGLTMITHIAFRTLRFTHNNREHLHAVWIGGRIKP